MNKQYRISVSALVLMTGLGSAYAVRFPDAFQAALTNPPPAAEAAFAALAEAQTDSPYRTQRRDRAFYRASLAATAQQADSRAAAWADRIEDRPWRILAHIKRFAGNRRHAELLDLARDADFDTWPDALIYRAAMRRAAAATALGEGALAEQDLILAARYMRNPHHRARAVFQLAELYSRILNDKARAMQTYDELLAWAPTNWIYYNAAMAYARLAVAEGRGAEGLKRLDRIDTDLSVPNPRFPALVLECYADVLVAMGQPDEALLRYRKIVEAEGVSADIVRTVEAKVAALEQLDR